MANPSLNPNLKDFWRTRITPEGDPVIGRVLHGGRMSSKSHDAAGIAIARANFHKENFLCTRQFQNRISDSVYTLLKNKIEYFGLGHRFKIYNDAIEHVENGSLFRFYGVARNIEEIKSYEGATVWWHEEAHNLNQNVFTIVRPTIMRNSGAEMWFTLNPKLVSDYSYQRLVAKPPKGFLVKQINYDLNPFLGEQALRDIKAEFEEDEDLAKHIYLGIPLSDDSRSVIKRSWVEACVDAHLKLDLDLSGARCVGYDVADDGGDRNSVSVFDGGICIEADAWKAGEDELVESALRAWSHTHNTKLLYDCIGNGAHVGSTLKNHGVDSDKYFKFNAGGVVIDPDQEYAPDITNKEKFENLKAQAWQDVADRMRNTYNAVEKGKQYHPSELISISSSLGNIEELKTELCEPHKKYSKRGLDMVEPKIDVKKRLEKSHDLADSFIMGACPHLVNSDDLDFFDVF